MQVQIHQGPDVKLRRTLANLDIGVDGFSRFSLHGTNSICVMTLHIYIYIFMYVYIFIHICILRMYIYICMYTCNLNTMYIYDHVCHIYICM